MAIHPSAIIEEGAKLGKDVEVGPFCIVGANVELGDRVCLRSHVSVVGHTTVGEDTVVYPFASVGEDNQDLKYHGEPTQVVIGARNRIREHVTIHNGSVGGGGLTQVGDDCLLMVGSHVAHDCKVGNRVILANNATLAGHVEVGEHAIIGGLSAVHQFTKIGKGVMVGGMSGVDGDVIPYGLVKGERASLAGFNLIGLSRSGVDKKVTKEMLMAFKELFESDGTFEERKTKVKEEYKDNEFMMEILDFIASDERHQSLCTPKR